MQRIRNRVSIAYLVLFLTALFISAVLSLQAMESLQTSRLKQDLQTQSAVLSGTAEQALASTSSADIPRVMANSVAGLDSIVYVLNTDGRVVYASPSAQAAGWSIADVTPVIAGLSGDHAMVYRATVSGHPAMFASSPVVYGGRRTLSIVVATALEPFYLELLHRWGWLTAEFAVVAAIIAVASYLLARRLMRPLEQITSTTQRIADGNLRITVPYWGQDDFGRLSSAINTVSTRLVEQIDDLSQEKSKVEGIIAHMGAGVLVVDRMGHVLVANKATRDILACPEHQLIGRSHWQVTGSLRMSELIDFVLLKGKSVRKELTFQTHGETNVELFVRPIKGSEASIVGAVAVLHDVTDWRRVERLRTEFVANVSHELRTPITAVKGFAETLLDGAMENPEMCKQFIQIIYDESDRLSRLVTDLLELSKIESRHATLQFQPTDMNELIRCTVDRLKNQAQQQGLQLTVRLPETPVVAEAAADRMAQVVINLVANAIAYTPAPGDVVVWLRQSADHYVIEVSDTGIGIPDKDVPRIFERFYRVDKDRSRRTGGTGLGLAIVKHIVEAHHGHIEVSSQVGSGTTFSLSFPLHPNVAATSEQGLSE